MRQMGEGGFGLVWLAEQSEPIHREVAMKLIKPGMDSRQVIARFEVERQTIALMDHPNIAAVLDAGTTTEGRPFFVMELVRGQPITAFCDEHRLTVRQRLELFVYVCHAVQHAHQKAILHRDLKPSNILVEQVDGGPVPKVIDFGIAKALGAGAGTDRSSLFTSDGSVIGTPEYMSPEQADDDMDVDACSDIYSLGAIFYELLTGRPPIQTDPNVRWPLQKILRHIRETEPPRPSAAVTTADATADRNTAANRGSEPRRLSQELRGDIDWIVLKAIEKDRRHRYESAAALAADIQRYLRDEPVSARPPTRLYLMRKLIRRNKGAFVTALLVSIALLVGAAAASWSWVRMREALKNETAAKVLAEEESRTSKDVAAFLANTVQDISADTADRKRALNAAGLLALLDSENERRSRELQTDPKTDMRVATVLGQAYAELDRLDVAGGLYRIAATRLDQLHMADSPEAADCLFWMAWTHHRQIEESGASPLDFDDQDLLQRCLKLRLKTFAPQDEPILEAEALLAGVLRTNGKSADAASVLERMVTGPQNERVKGTAGYGWILREQALLLQEGRKFAEAGVTLDQARKILASTAKSSNARKQAEADIARIERLLRLESDDLEGAETAANAELNLRYDWLGYWDPAVLAALAEISLRKQDFRTAEGYLRRSKTISKEFHWDHLYEEALRKLVETDAQLGAPAMQARLRDITDLAGAILQDADRARVAGKEYRAMLAEVGDLLRDDDSLREPKPREAAAFFATRASLAARAEDYPAAIKELAAADRLAPDDLLYGFRTAIFALAEGDEKTFATEKERLFRKLAPDEALRATLWVNRSATLFLDPTDRRYGLEHVAARILTAAEAGHETDWDSLLPTSQNVLLICRAALLQRPTLEELRRIRHGLSRRLGQPDDFSNDWTALLMGLAEYRAGNYEDASNWLETAAQSHDPVIDAQAEIVMAMNSHQLHLAEAKDLLATCETCFEQRVAPYRDTDSVRPLHDYLATKFLLDEAHALFSEATQPAR